MNSIRLMLTLIVVAGTLSASNLVAGGCDCGTPVVYPHFAPMAGPGCDPCWTPESCCTDPCAKPGLFSRFRLLGKKSNCAPVCDPCCEPIVIPAVPVCDPCWTPAPCCPDPCAKKGFFSMFKRKKVECCEPICCEPICCEPVLPNCDGCGSHFVGMPMHHGMVVAPGHTLPNGAMLAPNGSMMMEPGMMTAPSKATPNTTPALEAPAPKAAMPTLEAAPLNN